MDLGDTLISVGGGAVTYFLGWWSGKKEKAANLEDKILKNIRSSMSIYEKINSDLKNELDKERKNSLYVTKDRDIKEKENQYLRDEINDVKAVLRSRNKLN